MKYIHVQCGIPHKFCNYSSKCSTPYLYNTSKAKMRRALKSPRYSLKPGRIDIETRTAYLIANSIRSHQYIMYDDSVNSFRAYADMLQIIFKICS